MAKMDITMRTKLYWEDIYVIYIIVYTNDKTVQGHRVYWSTSKVNIFLQWKVQRLMPTYPMQILTAELYHGVESLFPS